MLCGRVPLTGLARSPRVDVWPLVFPTLRRGGVSKKARMFRTLRSSRPCLVVARDRVAVGPRGRRGQHRGGEHEALSNCP